MTLWRSRHLLWIGLLAACTCIGQQLDVRLHVTFHTPSSPVTLDAPLIVWLSPLDTPMPSSRPARVYKMNQQNKRFVPHLLVVPVGSTVAFPNLDPYFHNVFSLFNGRRFDLGLYQTGQSQAVTIRREGVSYVFCNIHPQMGAVIVSLATPYYTIAGSGDVVIHGLSAGAYRLNLWNERATESSLRSASRVVNISPDRVDLGTVTLDPLPDNQHTHANKYGQPYLLHQP